MAEKLFEEFSPVTTEKWEEVITKDLKGADYEKKTRVEDFGGILSSPLL